MSDRAKDKVAAAAGLDRRMLDRAEAVVDAADQDPELGAVVAAWRDGPGPAGTCKLPGTA